MADPKQNPWTRPEKEDKERTRAGNRVKYLSDLRVPGQLGGIRDEVDESIYLTDQERAANRSRTPMQMTPEEMSWGKNQVQARENKSKLDASMTGELPNPFIDNLIPTILDGFSWAQNKVRQDWLGGAGESYYKRMEDTSSLVDEIQAAKSGGFLNTYMNAQKASWAAKEFESLQGLAYPGQIVDPVSGEDIVGTVNTLVEAGIIPAIGDGYIDPVNNQYKQITATQQAILAEEAQPLLNQIVLGTIIDPTTYIGGATVTVIKPSTWKAAFRAAKAIGAKIKIQDEAAFEAAKKLGMGDVVEYAPIAGGTGTPPKKTTAKRGRPKKNPTEKVNKGATDTIVEGQNQVISQTVDEVIESGVEESVELTTAEKIKAIDVQLESERYDVLSDVKKPSKARVQAVRDDLINQRNMLVDDLSRTTPRDVASEQQLLETENLIVDKVAGTGGLRSWLGNPDSTANEQISNAKDFLKEILAIVDGDTGLAIRHGVNVEEIDDAIKNFDEIKQSDYEVRDYNAFDEDKEAAFAEVQEALRSVRPRRVSAEDVAAQQRINEAAREVAKEPEVVMGNERGVILDDQLATPHSLDLGSEIDGSPGKFYKVAAAGDAAIYRGGKFTVKGTQYTKWAVIGIRKADGTDSFTEPTIMVQKAMPGMDIVEDLVRGADDVAVEWHPSAMTGRRGGGQRRKRWTPFDSVDDPKITNAEKQIRFSVIHAHGKPRVKRVPISQLKKSVRDEVAQSSKNLNIVNTLETYTNITPPDAEGLTLVGNQIKRSQDLVPREMYVESGREYNGVKFVDKGKLNNELKRYLDKKHIEANTQPVEIVRTAEMEQSLRLLAEGEVVVVVNRNYPFGLKVTMQRGIDMYDVENNLILEGPDEFVSLLMADPNQRVLMKDEVNPRAVLNAAYELLGEGNITNAIHNDPIRAMSAFDSLDKSFSDQLQEILEQLQRWHDAATNGKSKYALNRISFDPKLLKSFSFRSMVDELSANPKYHKQVIHLLGKNKKTGKDFKSVAVDRFKALRKYLRLYHTTVFEAGTREPIKIVLPNKWKGRPQVEIPEGVQAEHYFADALDIVSPANYKKVKDIADEDDMARILNGADSNPAKWTDDEAIDVMERMELYIRGFLPIDASDTAYDVQKALSSIGHQAGQGASNVDGVFGTELRHAIEAGLESGEDTSVIKEAFMLETDLGQNVSLDGQMALFDANVAFGNIEPWYTKSADTMVDNPWFAGYRWVDKPQDLQEKLPKWDELYTETLEGFRDKVKEFMDEIRARGMTPDDYPTEAQSIKDVAEWIDDPTMGTGAPVKPPDLVLNFGDDIHPDSNMNWFRRRWMGIQKYMLDRGVYMNWWSTHADAMNKDLYKKPLAAKNKAEVTAALTRGSANSAMYKVRPVYKAILDLYNQTDGTYDNYMDFEDSVNEYLILQQEYAIMTRKNADGELIFPDRKVTMYDRVNLKEIQISANEIQEILTARKITPNIKQIEEAALQVTSLYNKQLWKLVDFDVITPEFAAHLQDIYKDYVPMQFVQREILDQYQPFGKVKQWSGRNPIKQLAQYTPERLTRARPLDELLHNVMNLEFYANYNKTAQNLVTHLETTEAGRPLVQRMSIAKNGSIVEDSRFVTSGPNATHEIVKFRVEDKWEAWAIPKEEAHALSTLLNHNGGNMIQHIFRQYINRPLKGLFVQYNPGFLVYQFMFDMINVGFQHGIPGIADSLVNLFRPLSKDPLMDLLVQEGGSVGYWKQLDTELQGGVLTQSASDKMSKLIRRKTNAGMPNRSMPTRNVYEMSNMNDLRSIARHPMAAWQRLANHIETAPRKAAARRVFKKGGGVVDANGNVIGGDVQEAALAMRRVTGDFSRGGLFTKALDDFFAFANIAVQGGMIPARALKHNPTMFFSALATGITANAGLFAYNIQYDEYSDVPIDYRLGPILMLPSDPQDINVYTGRPNPRFIRLLPGSLREWMAIFGTQTYIMGEMYNANPETFTAFLNEQILEGTPIGTLYGGKGGGMRYPGLLTGKIQEQVMNKNNWSGQQIVPDHLANLPLDQQVNSATTEAAIMVGKAVRVSPLRVQHGVNMPLIKDAFGAADLVLNASGLGTTSKNLYAAEEILALMQMQPDEVSARKVRDQYLFQNIASEEREDVKRLLARLSQGKTVQGGQQSDLKNFPLTSNVTGRFYHAHSGTLHRSIKEKAQREMGVNPDAQKRVNKHLSDSFRAIEKRQYQAHLQYENNKNEREWKKEHDEIQQQIYGIYESIQHASEYDGSLQDRKEFGNEDIAQYFMHINNAAIAFGGRELQMNTHIAGWKGITPKQKEDGTEDWHTFFRDQRLYLEAMEAEYGAEYVAEFKETLNAKDNPTEITYRERMETYIRPYFEESEATVLDMFRGMGYGQYVEKWLEVQTMSERQKAQLENSGTMEAAMISSIDTALISERQRRRWSDGNLESVLLMYNYVTTPKTMKGIKMLQRLTRIDAFEIQQNTEMLLTN